MLSLHCITLQHDALKSDGEVVSILWKVRYFWLVDGKRFEFYG